MVCAWNSSWGNKRVSMKNSVEVKNISFSYGKTEILNDLSLDIKEGEFMVLLGPSGCGKTTLLNCIAGLLDLTDGQIWIEDDNVTWKEPKDRHIGMVFQSYALYPSMTVEKNLSFGLRMMGTAKDLINEKIKKAANLLQINELLKRKPSQLSGGQRQRVAIGRALVRDAKVFLFDEPLSNLDAKLRAELRYEIKKLHRDLSNTMIYVTHDQIEAMTLADRISVMKDGLIQQLDTPKQIYNKPANLFVAGFIGSPSMNFLNAKFDKSNQNILDAITNGTLQGLKLAFNVGALLLVFIALLALLNKLLFFIGDFSNLNMVIQQNTNYQELSLEFVLGFILAPIMWIIGVAKEDITLMGQLLGLSLIHI